MPNLRALALLFHLYPKAGFLYIIRHPKWGDNVYKIGRTNNWPQRKRSYNAAQPDPIEMLRIYICRNVHSVELHIKHRLRFYTIGDHHEFARIDCWRLFRLVDKCLELDEVLSLKFGTLVYRLFDHVCSLYATTSFSAANSAQCVQKGPLNFVFDCPHSSWIHFEHLSSKKIPFKVQEDDIVERSKYQKRSNCLCLEEPSTSLTEKNVYFNADRNGFVVDIIRHGKRYKKLFSVGSLGADSAKKLAVTFRDSLGKRAPRSAQEKQSIHKGVHYNPIRHTWVGSIQYRGARKKKEFSVKKYGLQVAEQMAWKWRQSVLDSTVSAIKIN